MKKSFLLMALGAALTANAQEFEIQDVTIAQGESGYIVVKFTDVPWNELTDFQFAIRKIDDKVTLGVASDVKFNAVVPSKFAAINYSPSKTGFTYNASVGEFEDVTEAVLQLPINVADDMEAGEYTIEAYKVWAQAADKNEPFSELEDYLEDYTATLKVTSSSTPLTYAAKIYQSTGSLLDMNFADVTSLENYVSANANDIVVFASAPAEFAAINNVVVDGVAESIVLTSTEPYGYAGAEFTAKKVSFDYWIGVFATKAGGWNSLAIPFTGKPDAKPFTTADMTSGEYWAKVFAGSTAEGLVFENLDAAQFEANKSYLVAFPGSDYGVNEFATASITISAENTTVYPATPKKTAGSPYSMTTIYSGPTPANAYVLNDAGTKFELKTTAETAAPFTAFASAESGAPVLRSLAILDANQGITSAADAAVASTTVYGEDGEIVIIASEAGVASIVNMNGQVVKANVAYNEGETRVAIAAGAYVVAGQVVIVK